mmetsp:Transcript_115291/g.200731  ORF Transcript_115291/g.200731 Transcript_115291/m.200731 type:complete len:1195 (-) Transcript_115291:403-3987(-)
MFRTTRSRTGDNGESSQPVTVSLGKRAQDGNDFEPAPKKIKVVKPREPLYDPNDMSSDGRYLTHFYTHKQRQLDRLQKIRKDHVDHARESKTEDDKFQLLMECVNAFVGNGANKQSAQKGSRRGSGVDEEDDDDEMNSCLTKTPPYLDGELRHYQIEGVNWMISLFDNCLNGILADEMGLGKTFQTIATLAYLKKTRGIGGPHLVVCPLSILMNWCKEVKKWCKDLTVLKFHGTKEERADLKQFELLIPGKYDIIVTTYETANAERSALQKLQWRYIVVDEAHRLKNEDSLLSQTMRMFNSKHRLLVTGTPLQNNLHELWALLNFLLPDLFNNSEEFDNWYNAREGTASTDIIAQMHRMLRPFMIRRLKSEVNTSIPPKKEIYVGCGMSKMQREWYTNVLAKDAAVVNTGTGSKTKLLNVVMQLRKCCNHPYLFDGAEEGPPFITDDDIVDNSGKMRILDRLLARLKADGHRVLVFCQMTRMLDIMEDYLMWKRYKYLRLDGSTGCMERDERMEAFNAPDSEYFIFMLSTRAGGLGINLATADTVILYDSDWNPQADLQAQDRAHRIGQKKPVTVFRFIADGTVEERVYQRALKKLYLDAAVIQQGRLADGNKSTNKDELLSMIRFGAESMFRSKGDDTVTDEDINILLQRGEEKAEQMSSKMQKDCQMSLANFSMGIEDSNLYEFEGVNYTTQPCRQIYLRGIDETVVEEDLRMQFLECGEIKRIIISPERDIASIEFGALASAQRAYTSIKNTGTVKGCTNVEVLYGNKAAMNIVGVDHIQDAFAVKSKRTCVIDYNEAQLAAQNVVTEVRGPKLPKKPSFPPWQFFDQEKLERIWELECKYIIKEHERKLEEKRLRKLKKQQDELLARRAKAEAAAKAKEAGEGADMEEDPQSPTSKEDHKSGKSEDVKDSPNKVEDEISDDEEDKDEAKDGEGLPREFSTDLALTSREKREKEECYAEGFPDWRHHDYHRFVKAVVNYGKQDLENICRFVEDKDPEEVKRYSEAFWTLGRMHLGPQEWDRCLKRIDKAQAERDAHQGRVEALKWKVDQYEDLSQLTFGTLSRQSGCAAWDEEEDRQLVDVANQVGYEKWDEIAEAMEQVPSLIFDWHIKTRGPAEYKVRTDHLIRMIEREQNPELARAATKPKTRGRTKQMVNDADPASPTSANPASPLSADPAPAAEGRVSRATKKRTF